MPPDRYRPRRRPQRPFPIGTLLTLAVLLPALAAGGWFGYRALKKSGALPEGHESKVERGKKRLLGEWTFFDHEYLVNLKITDGRIDISATKNGVVRNEYVNWKVESGDDRALTLTITSPHPEERLMHWDFEFISDSEVRITMQGSRYPPRVYTKKGGGEAPALAGLTGNARRLVGKWETMVAQGGVKGRAVYEYDANGSASMTVYPPSGESMTVAARWEVKGESGDTVKVRVTSQGIGEERNIQFISDNEHLLTLPGKPSVKFKRVP